MISLRSFSACCTLSIFTPLIFTPFFFASRGEAADFHFPAQLPDHPRLFLTAAKEEEIKNRSKTDPFLARQLEALLEKAGKMLHEGVTVHRIPDGKRLLAQSRRSLERTSTFAFAYRMTDDRKYLDAALEEMLAVCRFRDWNPSHYLDTAEMATAVGLGYDWLHGSIPEKAREEIRSALVRFAMDTGADCYEKQHWWTSVKNNWNEVCNAGLTIGALAVADEERELAERIVSHALASIPNGLKGYSPDGAYPEGPGYWSYGATYTGLMIMALKDVFNDDFGLTAAEGLNVTGDYFMGTIAPGHRFYNYADGGEGVDLTPMMFVLSRCYQRPDYALWFRDAVTKHKAFASGRFAVFRAIWYDSEGTVSDFAETPLARTYRGIQDIVTMRTAWDDPNAAFLGFKAGDNRANHGHLDIGSFVYDVDGERWASDLGGDDYNMPGYFGKQRWEYYRLNNLSHNTLVIGDRLQNPAAACRIVAFVTDTGIARAVADMTEAYRGQLRSARRCATLMKDRSLMIEDRLEGVRETVRWAMMTRADIAIDGKKAVLTRGNKAIVVELTSDEAGAFAIVSVIPPTERENRNKGYSMLAAFAKPKDERVTIRVVMKPGEREEGRGEREGMRTSGHTRFSRLD